MKIFKVPGDMDGMEAIDFVREHLFNVNTDALFAEGKVRKFPFMQKIGKDNPLAKKSRIALLGIENRQLSRNNAEIVYEDEEFLVFNKPHGMECIGKVEDGTNLHLCAVAHMKRLGEYDLDTLKVPYVCNVLPKEFGGLSIVAKDQYLFEELLRAFRERRIKRTFYVIVSGEPEEESMLYGYLQYQNLGNKASITENMNRKARPAALRYRLIDRRDELSLIEVEPLSFLKDQIPSQLAGAGLPVLGDVSFGKKDINRKYSVYKPAIWGNSLVFETGVNNYLDYLNGKSIETIPYSMSGMGYFMKKDKNDLENRVEMLNVKQIKNVSRIIWSSFSKSLLQEFDRDFITGFRNENRVIELLKDIEQGTVFFGCYGSNGIAGIISVDEKGLIRRLYVLKSQQRKGVGTLLLEYAENWCHDNNISTVTVDAVGSSYSYFAEKGYRAVNRDEDREGHILMSLDIM